MQMLHWEILENALSESRETLKFSIFGLEVPGKLC